MSSQRIFAALAVAAALFCAAVAGVSTALPSQQAAADPNKSYSYVYSGAKSASPAFSSASLTPDTYALFGSSELSTPPSLVPQVPAVVFGGNDYGIDVLCIGEAFDQSLWQAIAAGAWADALPNKKVAVVVSPSWFFDGGVDNSVFYTRFSYSLYRQFARNAAISADTKAYVAARLEEQGIDSRTVAAALRANPLDAVNDFFFSWADDLRLRRGLQSVAQYGMQARQASGDAGTQGVQTPPFSVIRERALEDAAQRSTNEWGFDDDFWEENVGQYKDQIAGRLASETFTDTPEYDDFGLFLRVCQETGLEPLVIVSPLSGDYYDWVGVDAACRRTCYDHILEICAAYGVSVADFSGHEYERYFLHDQVHFGWTGWVDVEEAIYTFAKEQ